LDTSNLSAQFDTANRPEVTFTLNSIGTQKFADFTSNNIGGFMAIVIDKAVLSTPKIEGAISGGSGVIVRRTLEDARNLADILRPGALPVNLRVLETVSTEP
jgi:preprotein translocase subunit SecD